MLPKLSHPTFLLKVPSTKKSIPFRPFLVKEEKILLMAKSSADRVEIFRAVKQVINNCAIEEQFDIDKLTIFDMEYLFLRIRAMSVNNIVEVTYKDNEDEELYKFKIDLNKIEVQFPSDVSNIVKITDSVGLKMRYPAASIFDDKDYFKKGDDAYYELIIKCIDKIYDGDDLYDPSNYSRQELEEFLDGVGISSYEQIEEFMKNTPRLYHKIEYRNKNGNTRTITLTTLTDFFILD